RGEDAGQARARRQDGDRVTGGPPDRLALAQIGGHHVHRDRRVSEVGEGDAGLDHGAQTVWGVEVVPAAGETAGDGESTVREDGVAGHATPDVLELDDPLGGRLDRDVGGVEGADRA